MAGSVQQGYTCGYLIAALVIVPHANQGWRMACGISCTTACLRALFLESEYVLRAREVEHYGGTDTPKKKKAFITDVKEMLKQHRALCIYSILLVRARRTADLSFKDSTVSSSPHPILI